MARKVSSRVVINRKALTTIRAAFVDGLEEVGTDLIGRTEPLDDPTTKERIVGDWGVWVDGKKVAGTAAKPKSAKVKSGITLLVGYPFPMRFGELGTVHQPARPRFSPTLNEIIPGTGQYMKRAVNAKGIR